MTHLNIFLAVVKNLEQNKGSCSFSLVFGPSSFLPFGPPLFSSCFLCAKPNFSPQQEDQPRGKKRQRSGENRLKGERQGEESNPGLGGNNLSTLPIHCSFTSARVWYQPIYTLTFSSFNSKIKETQR